MGITNLSDLADKAIRSYGERIAFVEKRQFRRTAWTYDQLALERDKLVGLLLGKQLAKGDCIAICAPNSPWWIAVYLACAKIGAIVVPIDVNSSEEFIVTVCAKTDAKLLFKTAFLPVEVSDLEVIEIESLRELLAGLRTAQRHLPPPKAKDVFEIVFTSGSTGDPKGVVMTNKNIIANIQSLLDAWPVGSNHTLLSIVPLSHMLEQTVGFWAPFTSGSRIVYVQSIRPSQIVRALKEEHITSVVTVPAFLSLLRRRVLDQAKQKGELGVLQIAQKFTRPLPMGMRRFIFKPIHSKLGPSLRLFAVGGASLPLNLDLFWESVGIQVLQGYGLTETAPIATYVSEETKIAGSVGRSLPNQEVKIAADGEILLAGDNVFDGYFKDKAETDKSLKDGWFHTGDIGRVDELGNLFITGRKKNMLLSESGLNIYPEDIETKLLSNTGIRDCVVLMLDVAGRQLLTAVLLTDLPEKEVARLIAETNSQLASHQVLQHSVIWPKDDFPRTPTRKVKRKEVQAELDLMQSSKTRSGATASAVDSDPLRLLVAQVASVPVGEIHNDSSLAGDLGIDSLKRLELVSKIEEEMLAYISESDIGATTSFAELKILLERAKVNPQFNGARSSWFESGPIASARIFLQLPLLAAASIFQKLHAQRLAATTEPVVYIANHTSHFDGLAMLRLLRFKQRDKLLIVAAKDYFFNNRFKAFCLRLLLPIIAIDREGNVQASLTQIGYYLDKGYSVLIFPEGTRSSGEHLKTFKPGIGVIAIELSVPIVPLKFSGNEKVLPKGRKWPTRAVVTAKAGGPVSYNYQFTYQQVADDLQKRVTNL